MTDVLISLDCDRSSALKEYFGRYLTQIRGLSTSSVKHYYDALNNISRRLKDKNLVEQDVYEIKDYAYLIKVKEILFSDPEFVDLDTRGRRMYSAGFNNYCRFASGEFFRGISEKQLDIPIIPEEPVLIEQVIWKRSNILRLQAFALADYKCEFDSNHTTFISENSKKPYMEGHHAIPIRFQADFSKSLDVYANIICLCPICHRKIHHGLIAERTKMIHQIYETRSERLANSGIDIGREEFTKLATT